MLYISCSWRAAQCEQSWLAFPLKCAHQPAQPQPSPKHQTTAVNTTEFRDAPAKPEHHDGLGPARSRASAAPQKISQPMLNYTTTVAAVPLEA